MRGTWTDTRADTFWPIGPRAAECRRISRFGGQRVAAQSQQKPVAKKRNAFPPAPLHDARSAVCGPLREPGSISCRGKGNNPVWEEFCEGGIAGLRPAGPDRAEGPAVLPAQGSALGKWTAIESLRPNGPTDRLRGASAIERLARWAEKHSAFSRFPRAVPWAGRTKPRWGNTNPKRKRGWRGTAAHPRLRFGLVSFLRAENPETSPRIA